MSTARERIREAGVVGCGGAGFPTAVKLADHPQWLIVNGMECEPLLRTDRYVMRSFAPQLTAALARLGQELHAGCCVIALKESYTEEIAALQGAIAAGNYPIVLHTVTSFYPAGDEQVVVHEVTGRTVPPGGLPMAVGCVVINAGTLLASAEAMEGKPFTHRYLTVGGAVAEPTVVYAPIGTPFADCIALAGGPNLPTAGLCVAAGGPMMGKRYDYEALDTLYVEKTTSGILVLPKDQYSRPVTLEHLARLAKTACIQCRYCTDLCPRYLMGHPLEPHRIMRQLAYHRMEDFVEEPVGRMAALCCECGVCELYACPMGLRPRTVNALLKQALLARGLRPAPETAEPEARALREARKIPSRRAAARAGVGPYYDADARTLRKADPERLHLALKQGAGAPAQPEVAVGDLVRAGERIARCPEGSLGAHLFAPISGRVSAVGSHICIER